MPLYTGTTGSDTLTGSSGIDTIIGLAGADSLSGANGNDIFGYYVADTGVGDTIDGGSGNDIIQSMEANVAIPVGVWTNVERVLGAYANTTVVGTFGDDVITLTNSALISIGAVNGGDGNDVIRAGSMTGAQVYQGGNGWDVLEGGANNAIVSLKSFGPTNGIEEISAGGYSNVTIQGSATADSFDFSGVVVTGAVIFDMGSGDDTLIGSPTNDILYGAVGNDSLAGGEGDDIFNVGNGFDTVLGGAGNNELHLIGTTYLGHLTNIQYVVSTAGAPSSITGSDGDNYFDFTGATMVNISELDGGNGHDTINGGVDSMSINGGDGNDSLVGGGGDDTLKGGNWGNDTLLGGDGNDTFVYTSMTGFDVVDGGDGVNEITSSATVAVSSVTNISAIRWIGVNTITIAGSAGDENFDFSNVTLDHVATIALGAGNDTLSMNGALSNGVTGGDGNDLVIIGSSASGVWNGQNGSDTLAAGDDNMAIAFSTIVAMEHVTGNGHTGVTIVGTSGNNTITFAGMTMADIAAIDGGAGNDTITGSESADTIIGGLGNDTMNGGGGNDTFVITPGDGLDSIAGGNGHDTIDIYAHLGSITVSAISGVEVIGSSYGAYNTIVATDSANNFDLSATAINAFTMFDMAGGNDTYAGSAGGETVTGGAGDDSLSGGAGNDVFLVGAGSGADWFVGGDGNDAIHATADNTVITVRQLSGIEQINSIGYVNVSVAGTTAADTLDMSGVVTSSDLRIDMGSGNDVLVHGVGAADTLIGGAGRDTITGGLGWDTFDYNATSESTNAAPDTITDFTIGDDAIDLATIDANTVVGGDQAFTWIGAAAFSSTPGQLRVDTGTAGKTIILGDTNGDNTADFRIELTGTMTLTGAEFIL